MVCMNRYLESKIDRSTCRQITKYPTAEQYGDIMASQSSASFPHKIFKREIENRCTCEECYPYHSCSSSSVHSDNTTRSSELFGDTAPIHRYDIWPTPRRNIPDSEQTVYPSISRQWNIKSTNPHIGQNGNPSINPNASGGWSSVKPFPEPFNLRCGRNSPNQLTEYNGITAQGISGQRECICTCVTDSSLGEYTDQGSSSQSVSLTNILPSYTRTDNQPDTGKPIIYLTFSDKSKRHFREIKKLCFKLKNHLNFSVKLDNYDAIRQSGELNILYWRDTNFAKALWILFCISPEYSDSLQCIGKSDVSENEKGIIYIHNISRAEFLHNGSNNCRMIPVIFTKSGATVHNIPLFLRDSPIFEYPMERNKLFERLIYYE